MTTFTLTGIAVQYNANFDPISVGTATFEAVFPDNQAFINYSVIDIFPEELPIVDIGGSEPISARINGNTINPNADDMLGAVTTSPGTTYILLGFYDPATNRDYLFQIGGPALPPLTTLQQFIAFGNSITNIGQAGGPFAPGQNIPVSSFLNVDIDNTPISANPIIGTDGDDELFGTPNDDRIVTGDATAYGDYVQGSLGNDTIDASGMNTSTAFMDLDYQFIPGPISVTINGTANTGSVVKSAGGTDTLIGIANPLDAGHYDGGLAIRGTSGADTFNVTLNSDQWISLRGGVGKDSYILNGAGMVRLDFRDGSSGLNINLATRQITNDGFGNSETIGGTNTRLQIFGTLQNDMFTGSAGNDIYRYYGGSNTINGGAGWDLVRYDANTVNSVNVNLATGSAQISLYTGATFTDTLSGIEAVRGSSGGDHMTAAATGSELDGRNGNDTLMGGAGTDYLYGGNGDDYINPGDNSDYDAIETGTGFDTVDFADAQNGYFSLEHWSISNQSGIGVTINSAANTGTVDKGVLGQTTLLNVRNALQADGLGIIGTNQADTFNVTVAQGEYLELQAGRGADSYTLNGTGDVRLRFDRDGNGQEATQGLVVNLANGTISNDGFGFQDSLSVGPNVRLQIMGTNRGDNLTGSSGDDFFLPLAGNDTINGGDGFDMVSYNRNQSGPMRIDLAAGTAQGTHDGMAFTDTLISIEAVQGSRFDDDVIKGSSVANLLMGRGGDDTLYGDGYRAAYDLDEAKAVYRLFQATLDREPGNPGLISWTEALATGTSTLPQVAAGFVNSAEFRSTYGALDNQAFVELLYQNVLGRPGDQAGIATWVGRLEAGETQAEVVVGFSESLEFRNNTSAAAQEFALARDPAAWQDDVYRLYQATLAREPDAGGFGTWIAELGTGREFLSVATGFVNSLEFQNTYGALDNQGFVELMFLNVLGRPGAPAGIANWVSQLEAGQSRAEVVVGFSQSAEFRNNTAPDVRDWIRAQGVDDRLEGGSGSNDLWGGSGADLFLFDRADTGTHRVHDFEAWDYLEFRDFGYASAAQIRANMTQTGADVTFSHQGTTVILENTQLASIDNDTFMF